MPLSPTSVSIVLPFRNAEATLSRAIESIVHQTLDDWELILVDHASTDGSGRIARQWTQQDVRIRLVRETHPDFVRALNRGLVEVRSPLVARMDADDVAYPERLARQVAYLQEKPGAEAVGCRVRYRAVGASQPGMQTYVDWVNGLLSPEDIQLNRFVESPLVHPSVMFRTELLRQHGTYQSGAFPEDYELWLRWLSRRVRLGKCPEVLLDWYDADDRLSRTSERYRAEAFYQIKTKYLADWLVRHNPFYPDVVVWGGGRKSRQRIRLLTQYGVRVRAVIDVVPHKTSVFPTIHFQDIAPPGQYFILSYVGNRGRREEIRAFLRQRAYREGVHFLIVA